MKFDFSRETFDPRHHYRKVTVQQGRVQTDADANEQRAILFHRIETEAVDLLGGCGGPLHHAGFGLTPAGDDLAIGAGRYYVDGVLCENEAAISYGAQPDLPLDDLPSGLDPLPVPIPPAPGTYLAYLDVWERALSALEAPHIREVALGGPDTAGRTRVVWQVKLHPLAAGDPAPADVDCASAIPSWEEATAPSTGELGARAEVAGPSDDPCIVTPDAGYRRLENQLYRLEVHTGGSRNDSIYKWDRDNGTVLANLVEQSPDGADWVLSSTGKDEVLRIAPGDWVELSDDTRDLHRVPGTLVRVSGVAGKVITVDPASVLPAGASLDAADFQRNPRVRRWIGVLEGVTSQAWQELEDGVQVRLRGGNGPDGAPRRYRTGDYWTIPARTVTGDVEWPPENDGWRTAAGIRHGYCKLALVTWSEPGGWGDPVDCRTLFPPVTELTSLFYLGGDGQECLPGQPLPLPLQVGVANGSHGVEGARIRFTVAPGAGELIPEGGGAAATELEVATDPAGVASCRWRPSAGPSADWTVEAVLLDAGGDPLHLPIRFGANLSTADRVAYSPGAGCTLPATVETVQDALDELCRREGEGCSVTVGPGPDWQAAAQAVIEAHQDFHLCFRAGRYPVSEPLVIQKKGHVTITGCGPATRFEFEGGETVFHAESCQSVRMADFHAEARRTGDASDDPALEHLRGVVTTIGCSNVTLERLRVACGGGVRRAATGITVRDDRSGAALPEGSSTRIRGCGVGVGHRQTGILVLNVRRAILEDNHLYPGERRPGVSVAAILAGNPPLRRAMGEALLSSIRVTPRVPTARRPRSQTRVRLLRAGLTQDAVEVRHTVRVGGQSLTAAFYTPVELADVWPELLDAHPVESGRTRESVVQHLEILRGRLLDGVLGGPEAGRITEWLGSVLARSPVIGSQGIVVARNESGEDEGPAPDLRILHNRIEGCQQGIHLGASHRESEAEGQDCEFDRLDTVLVQGNSVDVHLSPETARERHGIFVGNAWHSTVQDNRVRVSRTEAGADWHIDGIRAWGFFGPLMILRQNHIEGANTGIRVFPATADDCWPSVRHWYVADNVALGAEASVHGTEWVIAERNVPAP